MRPETITIRIVLHLTSGQTLQTEEIFPEDADWEDDLHEAIAKRGSSDPWRYIGHILIHPANVLAMECEPVNRGDKPQKGA